MTTGTSMTRAAPVHIAGVALTPSISPEVKSPAKMRSTSPSRYVNIIAIQPPDRMILTSSMIRSPRFLVGGSGQSWATATTTLPRVCPSP